jgi:hypothetical protein
MKKSQREQRPVNDQGTSTTSSRPRNAARICFDGDSGEEALPSYIAGIDSILEWCYANGIVKDVSDIFGPGAVMCTTPPNGTFHMELEDSGRSLEVLINARDLYVMGWRGPNGSFEIKSDTQTENYMIGSDVRIVDVSRNYGGISPRRDVSYTRLGIHVFRQTFNALYNYRGGSPGTIKEALGVIAVLLSEATRLQGAFDTVCASFRFDEVSRLYKWTFNPLWVNRYGHYCEQGMIQIDERMSGLIPPPIKIRDIQVESAEDIRREIRVFHIDAYDKGMFAHDPKIHSKPEVCSEQPSDVSSSRGVGTSNIKGGTGKEFNKTGKHSRRQMKGIETGRKKAVAPSYASGCPPSRRYKTLPVSSSPPQDHNWLQYVQRDRKVRNFLSSSMGGCSRSASALNPPMSCCISQFQLFATLKCKVSQTPLWSLLRSFALPTTSLQNRRAVVMLTTQLRTVSGKSASLSLHCVVK